MIKDHKTDSLSDSNNADAEPEHENTVCIQPPFPMFFTYSRDIMLFVDRSSGKIIGANPAAEAAYGYSRDELLRKYIFDLRVKQEALLVNHQMEQALANGVVFETFHRRKDGSLFPVEVSSRGGKLGDRLILFSIVRDITERKAFEQALIEEKLFSESLLDNSVIPTYVIDTEHKVLVWNRACENLTGIPAKSVIGTSGHREAFHQKPRPALVDFAIESQEPPKDYFSVCEASSLVPHGIHAEAWCINPKGIKRYLRSVAAPIFDSKGKIVAGIQVLEDITLQKQLQEKSERDFALARQIQQGFLPPPLENDRLTVKTLYEPWHKVSGDIFDYHWDNDNLVLYGLVADVMGHGLGAALQTSALKVLFRQVIFDKLSPVQKLSWINGRIIPDFQEGFIVAVVCFELDLRKKKLRCAAGGLGKFLALIEGEASIRQLPGSLLGVSHSPEFGEIEIPVASGNSFFFISDGLMDLLTQCPRSATYYDIVALLENLSRSSRRRDDATAVCIKIH